MQKLSHVPSGQRILHHQLSPVQKSFAAQDGMAKAIVSEIATAAIMTWMRPQLLPTKNGKSNADQQQNDPTTKQRLLAGMLCLAPNQQ